MKNQLNFQNEIIALRAIKLLAYNYRYDDIISLCRMPEFNYLWNKYSDRNDTHLVFLWDVFLQINAKEQDEVIKLALDRYSQEAASSFSHVSNS